MFVLLAGDDANIIFGAMYDENAQDEATITVIATGLDAHANTPVNKAMAEFGNFKPKMPSGLNLNTQSRTAAAEASATAPKAAPQLHAQAPVVKPVQTQAPQQTASAQAAAPSQGSYRPLNQTQINIPDFLKNKR